MSLELNQRAHEITNRMEADSTALRIAVSRLANGARLIDCGVAAPGGLEAGRLYAEACLGGLGRVSFGSTVLDDWWTPSLTVYTDHPVAACLASQLAGWPVNHAGYFAMGSGPVRALARLEGELFGDLGYVEEAEVAVLCLETRNLPTAEVAAYVAEQAGVSPEALTLLVAPAASPVGSVQIAARVVETAMHKLHVLGFDVRQAESGLGDCPLAPVAKDDAHAIGCTNDAVLYGGRVHLSLRSTDADLEAIAAHMPASASPDCNAPFYDILKRARFDFYAIDPQLFSPAEVTLANLASGRSFHAGRVDVEMLRRSFEV
jgi:methenyltetrahydromethanopterin cyclohydrolase